MVYCAVRFMVLLMLMAAVLWKTLAARPSTPTLFQRAISASRKRGASRALVTPGVHVYRCNGNELRSRTRSTDALLSVSVASSQPLSASPPLLPLYEKSADLSTDTIFALATGSQKSTGAGRNAIVATAVAIIRLSGPHSIPVLRRMLQPSSNARAQSLPKPRFAALRTLYDPTSSTSQVLDQAVVLYFPGPNSFTGEDVVELHCHGSRAVIESILSCLEQIQIPVHAAVASSEANGLVVTPRLAEPGEFTQRAFQNGKLDVLQVEALADLLTADTRLQQLQAVKQLDGSLSLTYGQWRQTLIGTLAHAEAIIDFGDDEHLDNDDDHMDFEARNQIAQNKIWGNVVEKVAMLRQSMVRQLRDARRGELIRSGICIAIVGPPNVGKSTLFNLLAARNVAIVSPTAGTTRDVLEINLNLAGQKCIVQDTAGIRSETTDQIEQEGIKRAILAANDADIIIVVIDGSSPRARQEGHEILQQVRTQQTQQSHDDQRVLVVWNKLDLQAASSPKGEKTINGGVGTDSIHQSFAISCQTQQGVDEFVDGLTSIVVDRVNGGSDSSAGEEAYSQGESDEGTLITRVRHRRHVQAAADALGRFLHLSKQGTMAIDMAAEELRLAASELGRITGVVDVEDVLDRLFTDFCIGK
jgi:tRNA modification GTPase